MSDHPMVDLINYIQVATQVYRKGEMVKHTEHSTTIDAFPTKPDLSVTIDLHFVSIGFTEGVTLHTAATFWDLIVMACVDGEFVNLSPTELAKGPSYIALGGWLGDQTIALQFMGLGELLHLWTVITPATLGMEGAMADQMAGSGLVMMSGFPQQRPEEVAA